MAVADPKSAAAGCPARPKAWPCSAGAWIFPTARATTHRRHRPAQEARAGPEGRQRRLEASTRSARRPARSHTAKETPLVERQRQLQREIESYRGQMTELSSQYATADVEEFHVAKLARSSSSQQDPDHRHGQSRAGRGMRRRRARSRPTPATWGSRMDDRHSRGSWIRGRHQDRDGPHAPDCHRGAPRVQRPEEPPRQPWWRRWTSRAKPWPAHDDSRPAPTPTALSSSS